MIKRFIADLNTEQQKMPSTFYNSEYAQVLDLSRRRDSVETRKTPSPYTSNSSRESASPSHNPHPPSRHQINRSQNSHIETSSMSLSVSAFQPNHEIVSQSHVNSHYPHFYSHLPPSPPEQNSLPDASNPVHIHQANLEISPKQDFSFNTFQPTPIIQSSTPSPTRNGTPTFSTNSTAHINSAATTLPSLLYPKLLSRDGKLPPRPFKAFPRDPLAMAATFTATDALLDTQKAEKYSAFRKRMMEQIRASNGGRPTITNPRMRRNTNQKRNFQDDHGNDSSSGSGCEEQRLSGIEVSCGQKEHEDGSSGSIHSDSVSFSQNGIVKDAAYFERRKKNNAAAKKSRDRRRIKEDEIAVRAAFLEHENIELRIELAGLKNQLAMLQASTLR